MEIIEATRNEPERLFGAGFWRECELEAARMLSAIADRGDEGDERG